MRKLQLARLFRPFTNLPPLATESTSRAGRLPIETGSDSSPHATPRPRISFSPPPTVDLAHERYGPTQATGQGADAIVIVHGLLSSAELWRTLGTILSENLQTPIYSLSLRNHGASPHKEPMSHLSMAEDVLEFCRKQNLNNISLLGHSLGAKVAMALALRPNLPPTLLDSLIVTDSAPIYRPLEDNATAFLQGMEEVERQNLTTREEAIQLLTHYTKASVEIRFILTNLLLRTPGNPADPIVPLRFRVPINTLQRSVAGLGNFPYKPPESCWPGKALFLKAAQSEFLNPRSIAVAKMVFPNMEMKTLEGGHWLHWDNPKDFLASVIEFLGSHKRPGAP